MVVIAFEASFVRAPKKEHEFPLKEEIKDEIIKEESEGVLNWLIEGCLEYQKNGLQIPDFVRQETQTYREENDGIGQFLKERCVIGEGHETKKSTMIAEIKAFCKENQINEPKKNEISDYLKENGFLEKRSNVKRAWLGVGITGSRG